MAPSLLNSAIGITGPDMHNLATDAAVLGATSQVGSNTVIRADANDSVTLTNVTASSLGSNNFHFS
jgi:hypothetical protein